MVKKDHSDRQYCHSPTPLNSGFTFWGNGDISATMAHFRQYRDHIRQHHAASRTVRTT